MPTNRRDFLKTSAAGSMSLALGGIGSSSEASSGGWTNGMRINPTIDNLRVVCCHDPRMISSTPTRWEFNYQNAAINTSIAQLNLDAMAMSLAQKSTAAEAWATIFQKPAAKQWSQVRVAMKVNCIEYRNMPRLALVDGVAKQLIALGVPAANIVIYDGCHNAYSSSTTQPKYNSTDSISRLPAGIVVSNGNGSLGGTVSATVPSMSNSNCTANIANGTIDILVNFALNKGHSADFGTATMTMKNHAGTFNPNGLHNSTATNYLFNINKSAAILGGSPVRQQLCVLDSLFASNQGPTVAPTVAPARIVMGVFGPAVDYLTVKRIREPVMSASHNATVVNRFLTEFGYQTSQVTDFINVPPVSTGKIEKQLSSLPQVVLLQLSSSRFHQAMVEFRLRDSESVKRLSIFDLKGNLVKRFDTVRGNQVTWDGRSEAGSRIIAGTYIVKLNTGDRSITQRLSLVSR
ncbi:MAG: DUF362 domain-containing protein [Chitinispirillaceae bacterium]|nr:DUF362 domain-containing protein [Chitinispirillaceae bacterium]